MCMIKKITEFFLSFESDRCQVCVCKQIEKILWKIYIFNHIKLVHFYEINIADESSVYLPYI